MGLFMNAGPDKVPTSWAEKYLSPLLIGFGVAVAVWSLINTDHGVSTWRAVVIGVLVVVAVANDLYRRRARRRSDEQSDHLDA